MSCLHRYLVEVYACSFECIKGMLLFGRHVLPDVSTVEQRHWPYLGVKTPSIVLANHGQLLPHSMNISNTMQFPQHHNEQKWERSAIRERVAQMLRTVS
eukprot:5845340-Amphidinium_carterae.1